MSDAGPAVALILADPQAAGRGSKGEPVPGLIERERMAIDHIIGVPLWQALSEDLEALAAVARARDDQLTLTRDVVFRP